MKNNHAVIICVESVFIEDLIVAFVSLKSFSRQPSGTKHNTVPRPRNSQETDDWLIFYKSLQKWPKLRRRFRPKKAIDYL